MYSSTNRAVDAERKSSGEATLFITISFFKFQIPICKW